MTSHTNWHQRLITPLRVLLTPVLDFALPLRCPACGEIVDMPHSLCTPCWQSIDFIGDPQCRCCGRELPSAVMMGDGLCGPCLTEPPPFERARAVMRYGTVGRTIAHRLKYSRRLSHAHVMAAHMQRLIPEHVDKALLIPVPLHRWRIWSRGFNQAALIADKISRLTGITLKKDLLRRQVNTPPLHSLSLKTRQKVVRSAFTLAPDAKAHLAGKTVILIDDIWTTGATASACARILKAGGAARVEVICWARAGSASD